MSTSHGGPQCAAATLAEFAANPGWLGATPAFRLVLHTPWALFVTVCLAGMLATLVFCLRAYRLSLADGLSPRT